MIDLIYNFILNTFLGTSEIQGATDLALLLTFASIILMFFVLVKLVVWCFNFVGGNTWKRK